MTARVAAFSAALIVSLAGAAVMAFADVDDATGKAPKASGPLEYPAALRERLLEYRAVPRFEVTGGGNVTWLSSDTGNILWDWKTRPDDAASAEWRRAPTLAETITLEPDVEYTFDTVWLGDCDELVIDYPFKADRNLLLRVSKGDSVIFDALRESARRSGKPIADVVSLHTPPTPAVAATVAAPGENDVLGATLEKLLAARAFCESSAALGLQWTEDQKRQGLSSYAKMDLDPLVLLEQPLWENSVVVLVYDPAARDARSIEASVLEADCPDQYAEPGTTVRLEAVNFQGPLFIGRASVEGAHGTIVKARYRRPATEQRPGAVYESAPIGMAFH